MRFTGKVALISGGGTGIGAAVARRFVNDGGKVVLIARRPEPLAAMQAELGAAVIVGDAADPGAVRRAVQLAEDTYGGLDVAIANAGGGHTGAALETDYEAWRTAGHLTLDTAFVLAKEAMPSLIRRRGNIVVVSSMAGLFAAPASVGYVTTKHALIGLTKSLARDYGRYGIRVNAVCPGWIRTEMADGFMTMFAESRGLASIDAAYDFVTAPSPLGRAGTAEEMANIICFLASPEAALLTGLCLPSDGGAHVVDVGSLPLTA